MEHPSPTARKLQIMKLISLNVTDSTSLLTKLTVNLRWRRTPSIKSLFLRNLHPVVSHHLGAISCPRKMPFQILRELNIYMNKICKCHSILVFFFTERQTFFINCLNCTAVHTGTNYFSQEVITLDSACITWFRHIKSIKSNQIKSNHFYCHITTAHVPWWVAFLRASSRQWRNNLHIDSTYLQTYTDDNVQYTHTYAQYTQCTIRHTYCYQYTLYTVCTHSTLCTQIYTQ